MAKAALVLILGLVFILASITGGSTQIIFPSELNQNAQDLSIYLSQKLMQSANPSRSNEVVCTWCLQEILHKIYKISDETARSDIRRALLITRQSMDQPMRLSTDSYLKSTYEMFCSEQARRELHSPTCKKFNFKRSDAVNIINGFVEQETNGEIRDLFVHLDADTQLVLVSILRFTGEWKESLPSTKLTFRAPSASKSVPMLRLNDKKLKYYGNGQFEGVVLPYKSGYSLILMKSKGNGVSPVDHFTVDNIKDLLQSRETLINVVFPKFDIESRQTEYRTHLQKLGIDKMFDRIRADLNLGVDQVVQKSVMKVDERGTTATGAAGASLVTRSFTSTVVFDRPFVASVTDSRGQVLFFAYVSDPTL